MKPIKPNWLLLQRKHAVLQQLKVVGADLRTIDNGANKIAGKCALEIGNHLPCPAGADA
jgi:hypothetical protein